MLMVFCAIVVMILLDVSSCRLQYVLDVRGGMFSYYIQSYIRTDTHTHVYTHTYIHTSVPCCFHDPLHNLLCPVLYCSEQRAAHLH